MCSLAVVTQSSSRQSPEDRIAGFSVFESSIHNVFINFCSRFCVRCTKIHYQL